MQYMIYFIFTIEVVFTGIDLIVNMSAEHEHSSDEFSYWQLDYIQVFSALIVAERKTSKLERPASDNNFNSW